ncbi:MAG: TonB-dependent receptor [Asticcacaulis sp.]|nr:TonB-dependent receptor [Asticcacaulis sp.]
MHAYIAFPRKGYLLLTSALCAVIMGTAPAHAQNTPAAPEASDTNVVIVTGFRGSLKSALGIKKSSAGTVDAILSEDIAKFPDSNLAESMQRIPGVTLSRGDGGEGRNVSVRGLGPQFTRVRINGMEGSSQTGSSDIYGAGNNGRSFDFNTFPTEIFSSLSARKTGSADVEEGSLGATVDLRAPRPSDIRGNQVLAVTARGVYNELSKQTDPRLSILAGKKFAGGKFGILGSLAYQERHIREVGYSAVDVLSAGMGGNGYNAIKRDAAGNPIIVNGVVQKEVQPFCTPIGWADPSGGKSISPDPADSASKGATSANCAFNDPRTGTIAAYNTIYNLRSPVQPNTPGSGAFFPRIPRYVNSTQAEKREAGTLTFQWKPDANTDLSLDLLYSRYQDERRDSYIEPISFARSITNNGQPMVSVKDVQFDANGSLVYGVFDGVDVRSEGLVDDFTSTFQQANLNFFHRFNDRFEMSGLIGSNRSKWDGPMRLQTFMDAIDTRNFSLDFRNGDTPVIGFGFDVNNPANFTYAPTTATGDVQGGFSVQGKPQFNVTTDDTFNVDFKYRFTDSVTAKFGMQERVNDFNSHSLNLIPSQVAVKALPAGTTLASLTTTITGLDDLWGHGAPSSWVQIDSEKWRQAFGFDSFQYCGVECGAAKSQIKESIHSAYGMLEFHSDAWLPIPVRGDIGVRFVDTDQVAVGYIPVVAPAGSTYPNVGKRNEVNRSYKDVLPSLNLVFEFTPKLLGRFSAAKVMSRPDLGNLVPSSGITATTRTGNVNNPFLDPIRAKTLDASLEWYFKPGSLASIGYFHKDIETFIQRIPTQLPFNQLGLPDSLLDNTNTKPSEIFTVNRYVNTPGGPLDGVELNVQTDLDFLPGIWKNLGVLANYTHVQSKINYQLNATTFTVNDLTGLSRDSASATLYYEDDRFSIRTTGTYRGKYLRGIPASTGSDIQGNDDTFYLDGSASWSINDHLKLIVEAQNLTDEKNRLYIDSVRQDTLFQTRIGRTVTFGVNYKY